MLGNPRDIMKTTFRIMHNAHSFSRHPVILERSTETMYMFSLNKKVDGSDHKPTIGIFSSSGILVESFSLGDSHHDKAKRDILTLVTAGATTGPVDESYQPCESVSEFKAALMLPEPLQRLRLIGIFAKLMGPNVNETCPIGILRLNQNCHSASLLTHSTPLDIHRFKIITYMGTCDGYPMLSVLRSDYRLTMDCDPPGNENTVLLRGRHLNLYVLRGLSTPHDQDEYLSNLLLVNDHKSCLHQSFE